MKNLLGYSAGFGDLAIAGGAALVLIGGLALCWHVVVERPRYNARKGR